MTEAVTPDWDALLDRARTGACVSVVFQPIVDLQRLAVAGYEALARFDSTPAFTPDHWFAAAAARGMGAELESVVLRRILAQRDSLPANCFLTVNIDPESFLASSVIDTIRAAGTLRGLVLEVTEHRPILDRKATLDALEELRKRGAMLAVDDAGAGYAGLQQILSLRPSFLKLDRALVEGVDGDEAKAALVEMMGAFANRLDAWLVAEGVETLAEARRLRELGVPLAQGYFFARPAAPWSQLDTRAIAALPDPVGGTAETLEPLLDAVRVATLEQVEPHCTDLVVIVDEHQRPSGIWQRGAVRSTLTANVHSTKREIAHRLATRKDLDAALPVVVTSNEGHCLGVVTMTRLLAALATN